MGKSHYTVHELSQFDLEVYRSDTLADAPEVAGNLAGLYSNLYGKFQVTDKKLDSLYAYRFLSIRKSRWFGML